MKVIKFLVAMLLVISCFTFVSAQRQGSTSFPLDTLVDADTANYEWSARLDRRSILEYQVVIDSIDGTPAGSISYQYRLLGNSPWIEASTDAIADALQTNVSHKETDFIGYNARIQVITSGTDSVTVTPIMSYRSYTN